MQKDRKAKNFLPKAQYKGGSKAIGQFIAKHLKYPEEALKEKIEGTVVLRAAINYKGEVVDSKIKSGIGYGCNKEAQRVVKLLKFELSSKVRKGKILFHKNFNIHFRLPKPTVPKARKVDVKKAESSSTQLSYTIKKKPVEQKSQTSYSYTITY